MSDEICHECGHNFSEASRQLSAKEKELAEAKRDGMRANYLTLKKFADEQAAARQEAEIQLSALQSKLEAAESRSHQLLSNEWLRRTAGEIAAKTAGCGDLEEIEDVAFLYLRTAIKIVLGDGE